MNADISQLQSRIESLEAQVTALEKSVLKQPQGTRYVSKGSIFGLPWISIAVGPDASKGEMRGHARGVIAIGDVATGVFALGGLARGGLAIGGLAVGVFAIGGCGIGILALGGAAIGGIAIGGAALGGVALGGGAAGYYAMGGNAIGKFVLTAAEQQPQSVEFFGKFVPLPERLMRN